MIEIPPYLKKGDTIGIVAPAGYMPIERLQSCIEMLDNWGYTIRLGKTTHSNSANYFSGTDEERCADLQEMLDDRNIKAILCARGGYGMSRIIDHLNFKKFRKNPKWIIGFSDITVLHAHLFNRYKIASLHGPMAAAFIDIEYTNPSINYLHRMIEGQPLKYEWGTHELNREGDATGYLIGGNLTLLVHLIGTKSDFKTKNNLLFLEDVGEYLYNIDRMMLQLKRNGKLDKIAGLIVGGFTDSKDTERPFGKTEYEIIYEQVKEYDFPLCFDIPISHGKDNHPIKVGAQCNLKVENNIVRLEEIIE